MDAKDKEVFIRQLLGTLADELVADIPDMPESWDGIELRWNTAERAQGLQSRHDKRSGRYRNYKSDCYAKCLW